MSGEFHAVPNRAFVAQFESPKARLAAALSGANTLEELRSMSIEDLFQRYGIGKWMVIELEKELAQMGQR